ncbi:DNA repair and recombination protein RAD52/RAD22 [Trachipleistophora hominis]|uniref:DNA repair and recombination protein RAD52/RAD22 n=1 Tax=Trachipleistophora hominis TaxID=72359 RepID=L7JTH3_TRAHO|nr:DNA repair and recombination protein RAD52/RAD22 [Trachipleistophora hominis]
MPRKQLTPSQRSFSHISKELNKKLGPEYISYRQAFNNTHIAYIEGWTAINIANRIFGYNGWSSKLKQITIDYIDECNQRYSVGVSAVVRVLLSDGAMREDVGFGSADNQRVKSQAIEKAKKEAVTDALKRALRQFGNALGNCCYDKEFLRHVRSVKRQDEQVLNECELLRRMDVGGDECMLSLESELDDLVKREK